MNITVLQYQMKLFQRNQEFFFTKVAPVQNITDIVLLGFSLIPLPGVFIYYYTIIYFFVKNFFSNIYISVNTIFGCSYLSFGWKLGHPLSMYVTRGMGEGSSNGSSKMFSEAYRGNGLHVSYVRTHLHYHFSCFCRIVSCFICKSLTLPSFRKGGFTFLQ